MQAIVSGRAGRALILDGESLNSIEIDDPSKLVLRRRSDLPYLFGEASDLRTIENTTIESVERELRLDCHFTWALDLTLISLDADLEDEIRNDALEELEKLFTDEITVIRVENVLYSAPLPDDADLIKALELCESKALNGVLEFLRRLEDSQPLIEKANQAWETIPTATFGDYENKKIFKHTAVQEGLFRDLVTLDLSAAVSTILLNAGLKKSVQQLPNHRQVLQAWTSPFRQSRKAAEVVSEDDTEDIFEERSLRRGRIDRRAVLRETVRKKSVIVEAMYRRDLARVEELIDELVAYQQSNSESQHTAKSLCDLAMEAKTLGMSSLQLALTERSINIAPGDGWSWAQHADALLGMGRLNEALKAYEQAEAFGRGVIAKTGSAGVLKAQGRFNSALKLLNEVIREHPNEIVAMNGRAEVLKAQGRFAEALAAFEAVIRLRPDDVVPKNGRAEVLKAQGRLTEALAAFDEIIKLYPKDEIAKTGRICVLAELGRYEEALASLPTGPPFTLDDWINYHVRGMILLRLKRTAEAIRLFDHGLQNNPFPSRKGYFQGALGLAWLRSQDYRKAEESLEAITSPLLQPVANVIRIHAFGAQGNHQRALKAYEDLATTPYLQADELTQELRHQYVLQEKSTKDDEWIFDREVGMFLRAA